MPNILVPQTRLPAMDLPQTDGGRFQPLQNVTENFQILIFYRGLHCPKCKDQLKDIDAQYEELTAQGLVITAISMDSQERAEKTVKEWELENLPVAYGLSITDAKAYGLFLSDQREGSDEPKIFSEPAIMVAKSDGSLYAEYIQNTPFGRPPIKEIAAGLKFVRENDYPVRGTSTA